MRTCLLMVWVALLAVPRASAEDALEVVRQIQGQLRDLRQEWQTEGGAFRLEATLAAISPDGKVVTLRRRDGTLAELPVKTLCERQRVWVSERGTVLLRVRDELLATLLDSTLPLDRPAPPAAAGPVSVRAALVRDAGLLFDRLTTMEKSARDISAEEWRASVGTLRDDLDAYRRRLAKHMLDPRSDVDDAESLNQLGVHLLDMLSGLTQGDANAYAKAKDWFQLRKAVLAPWRTSRP